MRIAKKTLYIISIILFVVCFSSSRIIRTQKYYDKGLDRYDNCLIYVYEECVEKDTNKRVFGVLIGTQLGRQIFKISEIQNNKLVKESVYEVKPKHETSYRWALEEEETAYVVPLFTMVLKGDEYSFSSAKKKIWGTLCRQGARLIFSMKGLFKTKTRDFSLVNYRELVKNYPPDNLDDYSNSLLLYASNSPYYHSQNHFYLLIGEYLLSSANVATGRTSEYFLKIQNRNDTNYVRSMYYIEFVKKDEKYTYDNNPDLLCVVEGNGLIATVWRDKNIDTLLSGDNNDTTKTNPEHIRKKDTSIVYYGYFPMEPNWLEYYLIDYHKCIGAYHSCK